MKYEMTIDGRQVKSLKIGDTWAKIPDNFSIEKVVSFINKLEDAVDELGKTGVQIPVTTPKGKGINGEKKLKATVHYGGRDCPVYKSIIDLIRQDFSGKGEVKQRVVAEAIANKCNISDNYAMKLASVHLTYLGSRGEVKKVRKGVYNFK